LYRTTVRYKTLATPRRTLQGPVLVAYVRYGPPLYRRLVSLRTLLAKASLELYSSGLAFSPTQSVFRRSFGSQIPVGIDIRTQLPSEWSVCIQTLEGHLSWVNLNLWCLRLRWIFPTWQLALARIGILGGNPLAYGITSMKPALLSGGIGLDSSDTIRLTNIRLLPLKIDPHLGTQWYHSSPMQGHSNWNLGQGARTFAVSLRVSSACFLEWRSYQGAGLRSRSVHQVERDTCVSPQARSDLIA
jgi:hypothetical protein